MDVPPCVRGGHTLEVWFQLVVASRYLTRVEARELGMETPGDARFRISPQEFLSWWGDHVSMEEALKVLLEMEEG